MDIYIGFDSAWTDNQNAPGAICAVGIEGGVLVQFHAPELASFDKALIFIRNVRSNNGKTLIAIDQPTVIPNLTGCRPVDRVLASVIGWLGGGVQPASQEKKAMFGDGAPIRSFIKNLENLSKLTEPKDLQESEQARVASEGLYLMEVYPALALASLGGGLFMRRLGGPKYNPKNKNYCKHDWAPSNPARRK